MKNLIKICFAILVSTTVLTAGLTDPTAKVFLVLCNKAKAVLSDNDLLRYKAQLKTMDTVGSIAQENLKAYNKAKAALEVWEKKYPGIGDYLGLDSILQYFILHPSVISDLVNAKSVAREIARLQKTKSDAWTNYLNKCADYNIKRNKLDNDLKNARKAYNDLLEYEKKLTTYRDMLQRNIDSKDENIKSIENSISKINEEIEDVKAKKEENPKDKSLTQRLKELEQKLDSAEKELKKAKKEKDEMQRELDNINEALNGCASKNLDKNYQLLPDLPAVNPCYDCQTC